MPPSSQASQRRKTLPLLFYDSHVHFKLSRSVDTERERESVGDETSYFTAEESMSSSLLGTPAAPSKELQPSFQVSGQAMAGGIQTSAWVGRHACGWMTRCRHTQRE